MGFGFSVTFLVFESAKERFCYVAISSELTHFILREDSCHKQLKGHRKIPETDKVHKSI